jgi:16S rRNA C1402 N4-methylase RsmH
MPNSHYPFSVIHGSEGAPIASSSLTWELTQAVHLLRLTIADASLRAREDVRNYPQTSTEYWTTLGQSHGYQKAAAILREWSHPAKRIETIRALETLVKHAHERADSDVERSPATKTFYAAYCWALNWVLARVRELCVVHVA